MKSRRIFTVERLEARDTPGGMLPSGTPVVATAAINPPGVQIRDDVPDFEQAGQGGTQNENQSHAAVSNIPKTKHDTAKNMIANIH